MDTRNVFDTGARYSKPRIKEPQDFSCPKTLKVVSVTFHAPLDLTIHDSQGMYDPGAEHDACGVGMVTTFVGRATHKTVEENLELFREIWPPIVSTSAPNAKSSTTPSKCSSTSTTAEP